MLNEYWDHYYQHSELKKNSTPPSQFAAFVANEYFDSKPFIIDIGCGNGRDAIFFASYGYKVLGIDGSREAINCCLSASSGIKDLNFHAASIHDDKLLETIQSFTDGLPPLIYARFFLHAVDETGQKSFLELSKKLCQSGGDVAVEFRTSQDEPLEKVTASHFRRFIEPTVFKKMANDYGLKLRYSTEGTGLAKYKNDDAHVARILLSSDSAE